jgi:hypothetical protein
MKQNLWVEEQRRYCPFPDNLISAWGRDIVKKLIVVQLIEKLSFYGSQWFIEVFISFRHWTIS